MGTDRDIIVRIISDMLDNPNEAGVYPTSKAYKELEEYMCQIRFEAIGWCFAHICLMAKEGVDISQIDVRQIDIGDIVKTALKDLQKISSE